MPDVLQQSVMFTIVLVWKGHKKDNTQLLLEISVPEFLILPDNGNFVLFTVSSKDLRQFE